MKFLQVVGLNIICVTKYGTHDNPQGTLVGSDFLSTKTAVGL